MYDEDFVLMMGAYTVNEIHNLFGVKCLWASSCFHVCNASADFLRYIMEKIE